MQGWATDPPQYGPTLCSQPHPPGHWQKSHIQCAKHNKLIRHFQIYTQNPIFCLLLSAWNSSTIPSLQGSSQAPLCQVIFLDSSTKCSLWSCLWRTCLWPSTTLSQSSFYALNIFLYLSWLPQWTLSSLRANHGSFLS